MADAAAPNFSAPFNALIAQNTAPPPNPLAQIGQFAQTQTALAGAQKAQAEADDAQLANAQNHFGMIASAMAPLLAKGDNVTHSDVALAGANLVAETKGYITSGEISHYIANELPPDGPGIHQTLQSQMLRLQTASERIATMRGQTGAFNNGQGTQFYRTNSFTGVPEMTGFEKGYMTPAEAATPTPGPYNKLTGAGTTTTFGQRAEDTGQAAPGTYSSQGAGSSGGSSGAIPITIGPNGQIARRQQSPMAAPAGPIQTAPSPGQSIALKAGGDAYAAAGQNASTYGQQMTQLQSALTGLRNTNTGPGTESRQAIASYMLALPGGIGQYLPGVDPKSIQAYDEANKYLTQTAQGSPNATRSDAGLNTALASSPSVHISNAAAQDVLKANVAFRRAEMANFGSFQKSGQDPGQFQNFVAQRNQQIDPRAYSADMNTPAQREAYMKTLSPSSKARYFAGVRDAVANGAYSMSDLQGGANGR